MVAKTRYGHGIFVSTLICFWLICSCGSSVDFAGGSIKKAFSSKPEPEQKSEDASSLEIAVEGEVIEVGSDVFWFWQCEGQSVPYPSNKPASVTKLEGDGEYTLSASDTISLDIAGRFCQPAKASRDIVFVVDVSDSMRGLFNSGNDPVRNNTCGRNESIKVMLDTLEDSARVALVTFDKYVSTTSDFVTVDEFRAGFTNTDVLCEGGLGTRYGNALTQALEYLDGSRPEAFKEVYFISDGEPMDSQSAYNDDVVAIKSVATLATLMLKGDDQVLLDMATVDSHGNPLHAHAANSDALSDALGSIAYSELTTGTFYLEEKGSGSVKEVPLSPSTGLNFVIAPIEISKELYPAGIDVYYEYFDNRGIKYGRSGSIIWN